MQSSAYQECDYCYHFGDDDDYDDDDHDDDGDEDDHDEEDDDDDDDNDYGDDDHDHEVGICYRIHVYTKNRARDFKN